jgi:hypothetical protein
MANCPSARSLLLNAHGRVSEPYGGALADDAYPAPVAPRTLG